MSLSNWLPSRISISSYDHDWPLYLDALYAIFRRDFIETRPVFRGRRLGLKRLPMRDGRECTFWHFTTEGESEPDRRASIERCERIPWIRPIIENSDSDDLMVWENNRGNDSRILLYLESVAYMVVLSKRRDYILPWTAYYVEREHRRSKLLREYEDYQKKAEATS